MSRGAGADSFFFKIKKNKKILKKKTKTKQSGVSAGGATKNLPPKIYVSLGKEKENQITKNLFRTTTLPSFFLLPGFAEHSTAAPMSHDELKMSGEKKTKQKVFLFLCVLFCFFFIFFYFFWRPSFFVKET